MIPLPFKEMDVNRFVDVRLPSKRQIFARVGAFSSGELYSKDEVFRPGMKPTEQADALITAAENYDFSQQVKSNPSDDGSSD